MTCPIRNFPLLIIDNGIFRFHTKQPIIAVLFPLTSSLPPSKFFLIREAAQTERRFNRVYLSKKGYLKMGTFPQLKP
jgi:hypothetical protein